MAEGKRVKDVSLRFDWLELAGYMSQSCMILFHAWTLYTFKTQVPYFFLVFVLLPLIDIYVPHYLRNHSDNEQRKREKDARFLIPLYALFFANWVELYFVLDFMDFVFHHFSYPKIVLTFLMIWLTEGQEIVVGHELGHRKSCFHRFLGYLLYIRFLNTNLIIHHNKGHHKWVATPLDPASAVKGQTVWQFAAHSMPYSFLQGWNIEVERIKRIHGVNV